MYGWPERVQLSSGRYLRAHAGKEERMQVRSGGVLTRWKRKEQAGSAQALVIVRLGRKGVVEFPIKIRAGAKD